jgi:hypothetical protein
MISQYIFVSFMLNIHSVLGSWIYILIPSDKIVKIK